MQVHLVDNFNRHIVNLRVSVTDRCNFRCTYCMPADGINFYDHPEILTFDEVERVARIAVSLGIKKIRLTGGEPLLRKDLPLLINRLVKIEGLKDIGLTTNGFRLKELAEDLYKAGLKRINVSLDTLKPEKFAAITRRDAFATVVEGLEEAERRGFNPIRVNVVVIRGFTDGEIIDFAALARRKPYQVRFIEFMPLDGDNTWSRYKFIPGREIINMIDSVYGLEPITNGPDPEPATRYRFVDKKGEVGIIPTVSEPFCSNCNRIRLTADGNLRTCLFSTKETDLRTLLRNGYTDSDIAEIIISAVRDKEPGHLINTDSFVRPSRIMSQIGG